MDFFNQTGKLAIGSRLRMLTDKITVDAAAIYKMFGVDLKPKWFPVFFVLSRGEAKTITSIAKEIGHSHPSVSNIIKEMVAKGLVKETKDKSDGRRNMVMLSAKGKRMSDSFSEQCIDVTAAIEQITQQTRNDLWEAIEEWENLLLDKSLLERVKEAKKERESKDIKIVPYEPCYQSAFRTLNEEWILLIFGWKRPITRLWIIQRNIFWIREELFWWLFIKMSRSVYVLCVRWIIRFMIMSWPNWLSALRFRAKVLEYCFAKQL